VHNIGFRYDIAGEFPGILKEVGPIIRRLGRLSLLSTVGTGERPNETPGRHVFGRRDGFKQRCSENRDMWS
jgi:hypothetical protein